MEWLKKHKRLIIRIALIILSLTIILVYMNWETGRKIVNIIFISVILAYIIRPIRDAMCKKKYISKRVASVILILGILITTLLFFILIIPSLFKEISNLVPVIENLSEYSEEIIKKLNLESSSIFNLIYDEMKIKFGTMFMDVSQNIIQSLINFSENLIAYAVIPVIVYYLLSDGEVISNKVYLIVPLEKRGLARKVTRNIDRLLSRYIISQLFLCLVISILSFIAFLVLDIKFALILSVFNGLMNIIPYFGPIFGGLPAIIIGFLVSPAKGLWVALTVFIIQQVEGNILSPKITGKSTNMHPLAIIILLLIGDKLGGFAGMVLAVPVGVILKVIYEDINYYLF